ncbi:hypothetical protein FLAG1_08281 [Fusarium langsethiae]|uniref:BTB domain-containing protein n=1 Tax=Fusarium langsethiae TaxID=179993 RepID=A0A0M9ESQ0_FUSLA|nr:hypothetical protein FLAG1_08281 [Fusarium langsethiae]GKU03761.1 unnamed protein product [Fusarium langsethiae]
MDKGSIDGRRKNKNAALPQVKLLRKSDTETPTSLRPASPPKSNPWSSIKKTTATSLASMFPPLPKPQSPWSPGKMLTAEASREPSISLSESWLGDDIAQPALSNRSFSPVSNSSSTTRQLFEAAAPRAIENLWKTPFGADVLVRTGNMLLKVHRNIVVPQSGWFRDNLPPPNLDGTPVTVDLTFAPESVAHCLRFIYTGNCSSWVQFSWHYQTALEVIVREQPQKLMVPMRLAMASILDAMLFWLARQPLFVSELKSSWWKIMQMSMPDIAEYKRLCRSPSNYNSPLPNEMALREMFEEIKPGHERKTTKSVATQTGDASEDTVSGGSSRYYFPITHRERRVSL